MRLILQLFIILFSWLIAATGCHKKSGSNAPGTPPDYSALLTAPYVWRNNGKVLTAPITSKISGGIKFWNRQGERESLRYSSTSGNIVVYEEIHDGVVGTGSFLIYDKSSQQLVWCDRSGDTLYAYAGQNARWGHLSEKMKDLRVFRRVVHYYNGHADTTEVLADTLASIFDLYHNALSSYPLEMTGADSALVEYKQEYRDHGPSPWHFCGGVSFYPLSDSIYAYSSGMAYHATSYEYYTPE